MNLKKILESYLRVNLLGPGPRLMKKEFTWPQSHKGWETLVYSMSRMQVMAWRLILITLVVRGITQSLQENTGVEPHIKRQVPPLLFFPLIHFSLVSPFWRHIGWATGSVLARPQTSRWVANQVFRYFISLTL